MTADKPPFRWRQLFDLTTMRFLLVGVANTFTGLAIIWAAKYWLAADDVSANLLGYSVGLVQSFILNAQWTFRYAGSLPLAMLRFGAVVVLAYLANLGCVLTAIQLGVNSYLAQALGVPVYTGLCYLGSRWYAFRS